MKANELTSSAPHTSIYPPSRAHAARTMSITPYDFATTTSAPKYKETALCSSLTEILPLHSYCKNTLCHGKLQNAQAGSTVGSSRPGLAPRRPWWHPRVNCSSSGCVGLSHIGGSGSLGHHLENRPIHSHLSWFQCMKAKNLALSAPRALVWRSTRAKAVHTMPIAPPELTAPASAPSSL